MANGCATSKTENGTRVRVVPPQAATIRVLQKTDLKLVKDHFLRLDASARVDRFGHISDADICAYVTRLAVERGFLVGAFEDGTLRGVLEARPVSDRASHWESVVSIEQAWRRKGLALTLTNEAFARARKAGASRMYLRCSVSNIPGQHFLASLANTLREDDGEAIATVDLTRPALGGQACEERGGRGA